MELVLIRHALPLRVERDDGRPADPPLSVSGRAQAERLAGWLRDEALGAIYTSPMRRAVETAAPLARAKGLEPLVERGVIEFDWRSAAYVPLEELKADDYERWRELIQGGLVAEVDLEAFQSAVGNALERIIESHRGERVAVVCHGGVINCWAARILGIDRPLFFDPAYTSISRFLAASSGERSVASLNETAHLRGAASDAQFGAESRSR